MSSAATIAAKLMLESGQYNSGLDAAERKSKGVSSNITSAFASIGAGVAGMLAAAGAVMGVGAALRGLAESVKDASDLNETISKTQVVFGEAAAEVIKFGDKAATALGMSKNEALSAAATYGNLFVSMGMTGKASADMSTNLVTLAGDLASFNNMDTATILDKLRAGLTGESEPLKTLGININEEIIKAKALSMGLTKMNVSVGDSTVAQTELSMAMDESKEILVKYGKDSKQFQKIELKVTKAQEKLNKVMEGTAESLSPATKAQAVYALMLEQTGTAQGDFERTSNGYANQMRVLKATFENISATVGTALLPSVTKVISKFSELAQSEKVQAFITRFSEGIGKLAENISIFILSIDWGSFFDNIASFSAPIIATLGNIATFILGVLPTWDQLVGVIKLIQKTADSLNFDNFAQIFKGMGPQIEESKKILGGIWDIVKDGIQPGDVNKILANLYLLTNTFHTEFLFLGTRLKNWAYSIDWEGMRIKFLEKLGQMSDLVMAWGTQTNREGKSNFEVTGATIGTALGTGLRKAFFIQTDWLLAWLNAGGFNFQDAIFNPGGMARLLEQANKVSREVVEGFLNGITNSTFATDLGRWFEETAKAIGKIFVDAFAVSFDDTMTLETEWMRQSLIKALENIIKGVDFFNMLLGISPPSSSLGGTGSVNIGPNLSGGGSFVVPSGFPNDTFPVNVTSGEKVTVDKNGGQSAPFDYDRMALSFRDVLLQVQK